MMCLEKEGKYESYQPRVSVIIPSYNHSSFVRQAILSVVTQTYKNIELIVVDDGSTDESRAIIRNLRNQYNFKYFEQKNSGSPAAINNGLKNSTGDYICFLASDDFYHTEKIAAQIDFYKANPEFGFIHSGCVVVGELGKEISRTDLNKTNWDMRNLFNILLDSCFVSAPSVMIKRSVIEAVGNFDESIAIEDWDLWLRIAKHYEVGFQPEYFVYYRQHGANTYFSKNRQKVLRMCKAEKSILDKWVTDPHYKKIIGMRKLKWFYRLSQVSRIDALPYFFPSSRYFYNQLFYKGLLFFFFGAKLVQRLRVVRD